MPARSTTARRDCSMRWLLLACIGIACTPSVPASAVLLVHVSISSPSAIAGDVVPNASGTSPADTVALAREGILHYEQGRFELAIAYFQHALANNAQDQAVSDTRTEMGIQHHLALAYHYNNEFARAEQCYRQVIALVERAKVMAHSVFNESQIASLHFDFGVTLERLGKIRDANDAYNAALLYRQDLAHAWLNVAALHHRHGDVNMSVPNYLRVLALPHVDPSVRLMAMTNVAVAYELLHDIENALRWYQRAQQQQQQQRLGSESVSESELELSLAVHLARARRSACLWEDREANMDALLHGITATQLAHGQRSALPPFDSLLDTMSVSLRLEIARSSHDKQVMHTNHAHLPRIFRQPSTPTPTTTTTTTTQQLRVGYLSYDFTDHPTMHLLEGVFAHTDHHQMHVIAFGYGRDDGSEARERGLRLVDEFVNLVDRGTQECLTSIRHREIYVLMDAQGATRGARPLLMAARPAAILVNYLVYPGTSGAQHVDYVIVDRFVAPPETQGAARQFSEKLVLLPHSYQVNYYPRRRDPATTAVDDADEEGHEEEEEERGPDQLGRASGFVFANFNKIDKLEPDVFAVWMAVLRRVAGSSLVLLEPASRQTATAVIAQQALVREAAAQGVSASRIRFVPRVPKAQHLLRQRHVGLFLDTFVYGAHSTATDALHAGLPVLTLAGDAFASRVGVSLLANVGMPMLVTHSRKEFEDLAVQIATQRDVYDVLLEVLRTPRTPHQLFQTARHVRALEASQRAMVTVHGLRHGQAAHLIVTDRQ